MTTNNMIEMKKEIESYIDMYGYLDFCKCLDIKVNESDSVYELKNQADQYKLKYGLKNMYSKINNTVSTITTPMPYKDNEDSLFLELKNDDEKKKEENVIDNEDTEEFNNTLNLEEKVILIETVYEEVLNYVKEYEPFYDIKKTLVEKDFVNMAVYSTKKDHIRNRFENDMNIVEERVTKTVDYMKIYDQLDVLFENVVYVREVNDYPQTTQNIIYTFMRAIEKYNELSELNEWETKLLIDDLEEYYDQIHGCVNQSGEFVYTVYRSILVDMKKESVLENKEYCDYLYDLLVVKEYYRYRIDEQNRLDKITNELKDFIEKWNEEWKEEEDYVVNVRDYYKTFLSFSSERHSFEKDLTSSLFPSLYRRLKIVNELGLDESNYENAVYQEMMEEKWVAPLRIFVPILKRIHNYLNTTDVKLKDKYKPPEPTVGGGMFS